MAYPDEFPFDDPVQRRLRQIQQLAGVAPTAAPTGSPLEQPLPPLSPQDETSLLDKLWSTGGSALSWLGNTLDYLGRPVRGLLGGHPEELASLIPFSDTLGITDKANEVSGRGLLENWGVLDKQPEGAGFFDDPLGNVAGIGASIVTDPLSWLGVGLAKHGAAALSEGGQVARALDALPGARTGMRLAPEINDAGKVLQAGRFAGPQGRWATAMTTSLDDLIAQGKIAPEAAANAAKSMGYSLDAIKDQPLSGLVGVGPPIYGADNLFTLGHGPLAQSFANQIDALRMAANASSLGRGVNSLFDTASRGEKTIGGQTAAQEATDQIAKDVNAERAAAADRVTRFEGLGLKKEDINPIYNDPYEAMRGVLEKQRTLTPDEQAGQQLFDAGVTPESRAKAIDEDVAHIRKVAAQNIGGGGIPLTSGSGVLKQFLDAGFNQADVLVAATDPDKFADLYRQMFEKTRPMPIDPRLAANRNYLDSAKFAFPGAGEGQLQQLVDVADQHGASQERIAALSKAAGRDITLGDPTTMFVGRADENNLFRNESLQTTPAEGGRKPWLMGYGPTAEHAGGTASLKDMGQDPRLIGPLANAEGIAHENVISSPTGQLMDRSKLAAMPPKTAHEIEAAFVSRKPQIAEAAGALLTPMSPEMRAERIASVYRGISPEEWKSRLADVKRFSGQTDTQMAATLTEELGDADKAGAALETVKAAKAEQQVVQQAANNLAQGNWPKFTGDPFDDTLRSNTHAIEESHYRAAVLRDTARQAMPIVGATGDAGVSVLDNIKKNDIFKGPEAIGALADELGSVGKLSPPEVAAIKIGKSARKAYTAAKSKLDNLRVPIETARDHARVMDFIRKGPEALSGGKAWYQAITQLFKAWNIGPWPANKIRDLTTGVWQQFATGRHYGDNPLNPMNWILPLLHQRALLKGEDVDFGKFIPQLAGLSPKEATAAVKRMQFATNLLGGAESAVLHPNGPVEEAGKLFQQIPGNVPREGVLKTAARMIPHTLEEANPLNIRGVFGRQDTANSLVKYGMQLSNDAWDTPKGGMFLAGLSKGETPEVAAAAAKAAMVDFDKLTPFERRIMRPMLPFATWARHMVPWMLSELAHNPGGVTAQAVRAVGGAGQTGFTPKQLEGTTAVSLSGENAEGQKTFLSGTDLPFEVLDDLFHPGRTVQEGVQNTLAGWGGFLNPLLKVPIELATNRQLYSNRELSDLKGRLGYLGKDVLGLDRPLPISPLVEELVGNSPAARLFSTSGKLFDPRKGVLEKAVNLGTGIHTTTVDMPTARDAAAREAAQHLLQGTEGVRQFTDLYVKPEDLSQLSPDELKTYQLYKAIGQRRAAEAREKKKELALHGPTL